MNHASVQRGMVLLEQRRYAEASKYFREALASDPNDARLLFQLALCELSLQKPKEALELVERSIGAEPEQSGGHALRAYILVELRRPKEALESVAEALRLDPDSDFAFTARAAAYLSQNEWAKAEEAARAALALNPENDTAANQLSHSLRLQNRLDESAEQSEYMLTQDPDNADNHTTAGWVALQRGDHRKAEEHFLEALRIDASSEAARDGLKEAFRARSPFYRAYLNYCFFMQRFTGDKQWLLIIGLLVGVKVVRAVLPAPIAMAVIGLYLLFVLWVHVARGVGNLQIALDRTARHALATGEKLDALFVGAGVILGLLMAAAGVFTGLDVVLILGLTLIGGAFPMARVFMNASVFGRYLFAAMALFVYGVGIATAFGPIFDSNVRDSIASLGGIAIIVVIAVTWLTNVKALYRPQ